MQMGIRMHMYQFCISGNLCNSTGLNTISNSTTGTSAYVAAGDPTAQLGLSFSGRLSKGAVLGGI